MRTFEQWLNEALDWDDEIGSARNAWNDGYKSAAEFYQKQIVKAIKLINHRENESGGRINVLGTLEAIEILSRSVTPIGAASPKDPLDNF